MHVCRRCGLGVSELFMSVFFFFYFLVPIWGQVVVLQLLCFSMLDFLLIGLYFVNTVNIGFTIGISIFLLLLLLTLMYYLRIPPKSVISDFLEEGRVTKKKTTYRLFQHKSYHDDARLSVTASSLSLHKEQPIKVVIERLDSSVMRHQLPENEYVKLFDNINKLKSKSKSVIISLILTNAIRICTHIRYTYMIILIILSNAIQILADTILILINTIQTRSPH